MFVAQEQMQSCFPESCWTAPVQTGLRPLVSVVVGLAQTAAVPAAVMLSTNAVHLATAASARISGTGSACRDPPVQLQHQQPQLRHHLCQKVRLLLVARHCMFKITGEPLP